MNGALRQSNHPAFSISVPPKCKLFVEMQYRPCREHGFFFLHFHLGFVEHSVHLLNAMFCLSILVEDRWRLGTGCLVLFSREGSMDFVLQTFTGVLKGNWGGVKDASSLTC